MKNLSAEPAHGSAAPADLIPDPLDAAARERFGISALFPYQRLVATNILRAAGAEGYSARHSVNPVTGEVEIEDAVTDQIVILPTGAGKSLCFMLPGVMLPGITVIVFPLLSLMADQLRRLEERGIPSRILRGGQSPREREETFAALEKGSVSILITNPETLKQEKTLGRLEKCVIDHLVIDETHTVFEWGSTFRPSYLDLHTIYERLDIRVITAFTATASHLVLDEVKSILFPNRSPHLITADPDRPNIAYRVIPSICKDHDLTRLLRGTLPRPALVFCRTRRGAEETARTLRYLLDEKEIYFYHAGLEREEKKRIEEWFFSSREGILTATCAYGMGVDKSDIRTVIHKDPAPSVEAYLQESGRGGRDRKQAYAVLLLGPDETAAAQPAGRPAGTADPAGGDDAEKEPLELRRYAEFIRAVVDPTQCRREALLGLLGSRPEACFGCDVCEGSVPEAPDGAAEICGLIKRYPRFFTLREAVTILSGRYKPEIYERNLWRFRGFAALKNWDEECIEEAVLMLIRAERLRRFKWGPWKGMLQVGIKPKLLQLSQ
ncbi:MAG: RecQ family ATP-dependent DNA helicase [Spirochaetia bacterium]